MCVQSAVTNICQATNKQLFQLVEWAKHIPHFTTLPLTDQVLLLRAGNVIKLVCINGQELWPICHVYVWISSNNIHHKSVLRLMKFNCNSILDTERPTMCLVVISSSKLYMMHYNHHVLLWNKFFFVSKISITLLDIAQTCLPILLHVYNWQLILIFMIDTWCIFCL
jgi:hypothetical protein